LLQKETLTRVDLERIFGHVEKRPRITAFNDFGQRTPSDKPPIKTPAELARERGESWPSDTEPTREPTPVGSYPGGGNGITPPGPNGGPSPVPPGGYPGAPGFPAGYPGSGSHAGAHRADQPRPAQPTGLPNSGPGPQPPNSVLPNYGAPPDWRPATTPSGQSWPPPGWKSQAPVPTPTQPWPGNGRTPDAGDGTDTPPSGTRSVDDGGRT
ncbi:MAG TPA: cell division protein FtsH, partial [Pseudonocardia sp.]|nr:cell division protein FtsH [Pseudonocardia sp.]